MHTYHRYSRRRVLYGKSTRDCVPVPQKFDTWIVIHLFLQGEKLVIFAKRKYVLASLITSNFREAKIRISFANYY
jgi:hypothetical protein